LVVEPTHLKNMRKSNWTISPGFGVKIPKIFELPPPSSGTPQPLEKFWLEDNSPFLLGGR